MRCGYSPGFVRFSKNKMLIKFNDRTVGKKVILSAPYQPRESASASFSNSLFCLGVISVGLIISDLQETFIVHMIGYWILMRSLHVIWDIPEQIFGHILKFLPHHSTSGLVFTGNSCCTDISLNSFHGWGYLRKLTKMHIMKNDVWISPKWTFKFNSPRTFGNILILAHFNPRRVRQGVSLKVCITSNSEYTNMSNSFCFQAPKDLPVIVKLSNALTYVYHLQIGTEIVIEYDMTKESGIVIQLH